MFGTSRRPRRGGKGGNRILVLLFMYREDFNMEDDRGLEYDGPARRQALDRLDQFVSSVIWKTVRNDPDPIPPAQVSIDNLRRSFMNLQASRGLRQPHSVFPGDYLRDDDEMEVEPVDDEGGTPVRWGLHDRSSIYRGDATVPQPHDIDLVTENKALEELNGKLMRCFQEMIKQCPESRSALISAGLSEEMNELIDII